MEDDGTIPTGPLSPTERIEVREVLRNRRRRRWLWQGIVIWLKWLATLPATIVSLYALAQHFFGAGNGK